MRSAGQIESCATTAVLLVWEYSLTARKQWLYELGLLPDFRLDRRLHSSIPSRTLQWSISASIPYHVVLVNDELCAWGTPAAILQRRRACASSGTAALGIRRDARTS